MVITSSLRNVRTFSQSVQPFDSIPTVKGLPVIGTLVDIFRAGGVSQIHRYIDERHLQLGPIFREKLGHVEAVWVSDPVLFQQVYRNEGRFPELMLPDPWVIFNKKNGNKRGLFFMQGEEWAHTRKLLSPLLLNMATVRSHLKSFDFVAERVLFNWITRRETLINDLESELYFYFVQMILSEHFSLLRFIDSCFTPIKGLICAMFGEKVGLNRNLLEEKLPEMVQSIRALFEYSAKLTLVSPALAAKLGLKVWENFEQSARTALKVANELTDSCLMELETVNSNSSIPATKCMITLLAEGGMMQSEIQRIVADLLLAAADTTSHTAQWALYLLSLHPEVQHKALTEMSCAARGKEQFEAYLNSATLRGSVKEALRLYPVAPFLTRILPEESVIGNYVIKAKTLVLLSLYTAGRSEQHFKNAQQFMPERWDRERLKGDPALASDPFATLPFGHGKRACIGRRLAEAQMYIFIGKLIEKFSFTSENRVDMSMRLLGTVSEAVRLKLDPRS